jgi:hypothetical protein
MIQDKKAAESFLKRVYSEHQKFDFSKFIENFCNIKDLDLKQLIRLASDGAQSD